MKRFRRREEELTERVEGAPPPPASVAHWVLFLCRPFGVALGIFIALNLALALMEPRLSANRYWLDVALPEPWLSIFTALLGLALLVPHAASDDSRLRIAQAGVFCGFLSLAISNVIGFYHSLHTERLHSDAFFPFSLCIALILVAELARILAWRPVAVRIPRPARRFFGSILVVLACFVMLIAYIYTYGKTDFSAARTADAIVVLGARAYRDGRLSDALRYRMDRAIKLFEAERAPYLILSGGVDAEGLSEPRVMREYSTRRGVPPRRHLLDEGGQNTYLSAVNCKEICEANGFDDVFVVSQYFHNARVKLVFERQGIRCQTVPAGGNPLRRELFYLFREAIAYPYYLLFYR